MSLLRLLLSSEIDFSLEVSQVIPRLKQLIVNRMQKTFVIDQYALIKFPGKLMSTVHVASEKGHLIVPILYPSCPVGLKSQINVLYTTCPTTVVTYYELFPYARSATSLEPDGLIDFVKFISLSSNVTLVSGDPETRATAMQMGLNVFEDLPGVLSSLGEGNMTDIVPFRGVSGSTAQLVDLPHITLGDKPLYYHASNALDILRYIAKEKNQALVINSEQSFSTGYYRSQISLGLKTAIADDLNEAQAHSKAASELLSKIDAPIPCSSTGHPVSAPSCLPQAVRLPPLNKAKNAVIWWVDTEHRSRVDFTTVRVDEMFQSTIKIPIYGKFESSLQPTKVEAEKEVALKACRVLVTAGVVFPVSLT
jgi:hypothetical protein